METQNLWQDLGEFVRSHKRTPRTRKEHNRVISHVMTIVWAFYFFVGTIGTLILAVEVSPWWNFLFLFDLAFLVFLGKFISWHAKKYGV